MLYLYTEKQHLHTHFFSLQLFLIYFQPPSKMFAVALLMFLIIL